jgi:hypothetical protein
MTLRNFALFLFSAFFGSLASAQDAAIQNSNATSIKWSQITTPGFQVIFPRGFDEQAQRVARTLEFIREPEANSLGVIPKRIPIVLQNQTSVSNGFVTMAPRRSEFFTMTPQDYNALGTNDWLSLLASHEYRHIVQYQRSITGFNKFLYYLLGQNAVSLVSYAAVPPWFWEGDAVVAETAFTGSGRGRIPNFSMLFRTNYQEGRVFNYHKAFLRSYKDNIPDHYVLGYHMTTYLRNKTGDPMIWEKITRRSWAAPYIPFGFSRAIRKETGLTVTGLYREMATSLEEDFRKKTEQTRVSDFKPVSVRTSKAYTDYLYPQPQDDGSVIALKNGIGDLNQIVVLKDGLQIKTFVTGPMNMAGMLSVADDKVVWNEFRYDPRWRAHSYSVVRELDLALNKVRDVTRKSRYASAAISPDAKLIATVESAENYGSRLVVLDETNGRVVKAFPSGNGAVTMPRWSNDGSAIVALLTRDGKRSVAKFNVESDVVEELVAPTDENIGHPLLHGKYLFYNSPYSGVDNIYVLDTGTGKRYQVSSSKYGSFNPLISPDADWIYYNEQSRNGMDIVKVAFEPDFWIPLENIPLPGEGLYDKIVEQEEHPDLLGNIPDGTDLPVRKYSKLGHALNIHSWGPFFNSDVTTATLGIYSKDVLSTTLVNVGYEFDLYERTGIYKGAISYQGLYPVIDAEVLYGKRVVNTTVGDREIQLTWTETGATAGVRLPFVLTQGRNISTLTLKDAVGLTHVEDFSTRTVRNNFIVGTGKDRLVRIDSTSIVPFTNYPGNGNLISNQALLSFTRYWRTSRRDINPKWGQLFDVEMYSTPFGGDYEGWLTALRGAFYLPGFAKHHSLFARVGYQTGTSSIDPDSYTFRNRIFRPRGFTYPRDYKFVSYSANYTLPVWYPDIALGPIVNFQRIRTNAFFDYGTGTSRDFSTAQGGDILTDYMSAGVEVTFDINVMRLLPQLDIGFRFTKGISGKEDMAFEFLLGSLNF